MDWLSILGLAFGGALFLEGMAYALMPGVMERMIAQMREAGTGAVQSTGVVCALLGAGIIALVLNFLPSP